MKRGIYVAGLREEIVASAEQVLELLKFGEGKSLNISLSLSQSDAVCFVK